jgi:vacuolar-type H+-ATPase subunit I/STV1
MFKRIDSSPGLSRLLARVTEGMAKRRGLPVVIGIFLVIVSFIVQGVNVYANSQTLELIGVIIQHVGLLTALIGLLVSEVLGD